MHTMTAANDALSPLTARLIGENDLTAHDRSNIRHLLIAAYPQYAELWALRDFWGGPAEYRLLLLDHTGRLVAHLGFARRVILVGDRTVLVAGIGAVAVLPDLQGQQVGRRLLHRLQHVLREDVPVSFGFLQCRDAVVDFYVKAGLTRVTQLVHSFDPDHRRWQTDDAAAMILPALAPAQDWPASGLIDLMGMPW
jgi:aminoglycoside 2'-N-acetyltransferase I